MKKIQTILVVAFLALFMAACSHSRPVLVTDNASEKTGVAEASFYFGIGPKVADLSIKRAAKNGDITRVATVDFRVESKFFKTTYKTIVTGN